jgi:hypothetical protein
LLRHRLSWEDTTAMSVADIAIIPYNRNDVNDCHEGG